MSQLYEQDQSKRLEKRTREADNSAPKKPIKRRRNQITRIDEKLDRLTTFHKRKEGIFKKAYDLTTLTGCEIFLFLASETGQIYVFSTKRMRPLATDKKALELIERCLNVPSS